MFSFGDDRVDFNNVVQRGHTTLRHLLLKDWDASWETLPYPPAQGEFAVYDIEALKEKIDYAVTNVRQPYLQFYSVSQKVKFSDVWVHLHVFRFKNQKQKTGQSI